MNPDRTITVKSLEKLEDKLSNGHRGDPGVMSDMLVMQSHALRVQISTDFVKSTECASHRATFKKRPVFGWPAAVTSLGLIVAITGMALKFAPEPPPTPPPALQPITEIF